MTYLALVLQIVFVLVAFVLRTVIHARKTGSTGFRAGARRSPSEIVGAGGITAAGLGSGFGVILDLTGTLDVIGRLDRELIATLGATIAIAGLALLLMAQAEMGASWRIGVDPEERTELVTTGPFRWTRNPIFLGMMAFWAGMALMVPNILVVISAFVAVIAVEVQVRLVEEPYLMKVHGDAYAEYASRSGRLLPGIGRIPRRKPTG